nr:MAG: plasmid replication protein [Bacteriophage sp.]
MPTLDFKNAVIKKAIANIKANKGISFKSQLTNTSNYLSSQSDGILELASKVVPTPFNVNDDKVKVVEKNYQLNDFNEDVITYKKKTYAKDKYTNVADAVFDLMVKCTLPQRYVLSYIIHHLKWNSNTVTINYTELREAVKVNLRVITAAVSFLCDNDIIYRTDIKDMLIINHNVIFYGSIETFYKNYRLLCRNKPVIKGRKVILNK